MHAPGMNPFVCINFVYSHRLKKKVDHKRKEGKGREVITEVGSTE